MTDDSRFVPKVWAGILAVLVVATLLIASALRDAPAQEAIDNTRNAATKPVEQAPPRKMTPDLAVVFVQSEFPGQFINGDRLKELFVANCNLLMMGNPYDATVEGLLIGGTYTVAEATYIVDMSIYSTCPERLNGS